MTPDIIVWCLFLCVKYFQREEETNMAYNYNSPYGMGTQYPQQTYPVSNYQQPSYQPINANLGAKTLPYATKEEVQAQILPPNSQMIAIDSEKPYFYIKSVDSLGRPTLDVFKFEKVDESKEKSPEVNYLTRDDLMEFVTKQEFENFMNECKEIKRVLAMGKKHEEKNN